MHILPPGGVVELDAADITAECAVLERRGEAGFEAQCGSRSQRGARLDRVAGIAYCEGRADCQGAKVYGAL